MTAMMRLATETATLLELAASDSRSVIYCYFRQAAAAALLERHLSIDEIGNKLNRSRRSVYYLIEKHGTDIVSDSAYRKFFELFTQKSHELE